MITSRAFWLGCFERGVKTFLQTFVAVLGVGVGGVVLTPDRFVGLPWLSALVSGLVACLLSVAMSVGSAGFVAGAGSAGGAGFVAGAGSADGVGDGVV